MAARLIRPLYARFDYGKGRVEAFRALAGPKRDASTACVPRDARPGAQEQAPAPVPPRAQTSLCNGHAPGPAAPLEKDAVQSRASRAPQASAEEQEPVPIDPRTERPTHSSIVVSRDGRFVIEEKGREGLAQADTASKKAPAKPRGRRRNPDETLTDRQIIATTAAVIAISFVFTAFLPSILTRAPAASIQVRLAPPAPAQPVRTGPTRVVQPVSETGPAPVPAPAPPATTVVATPVPVLRGKQATGEVPVPNLEKAAASAFSLTVAEKGAVSRGIQELEKTAAVTAPRRPAPAQPPLSEEEKAAIERGLRELEKAAQQAKP